MNEEGLKKWLTAVFALLFLLAIIGAFVAVLVLGFWGAVELIKETVK